MITKATLASGVALANVRYKWLINGVLGSDLSTGITQPDTNFAFFRLNVSPPANAEALIVYDSTNLSNWTEVNFGLDML